MTTYRCVPSGQTVSPCPAGTAPDAVVIDTTEAVERYTSNFDYVPVQDVLVGVAMVIAMLMGIAAGRR